MAVSGVGVKKLEQYGDAVLEVVASAASERAVAREQPPGRRLLDDEPA
jgi:hypothetical protein